MGAAAAAADESAWPTTQAVAYHAEWVPYLDPPPVHAAVCLVDTGVNVTPDTPADSPDGPIVKRLSLDGGPGTAANSTWEGLHGTRMAFVGGAPINGWGTAGFWPGARIISIRATGSNGTTFPFDYYSKALALCSKNAGPLDVVAVNLSLSCECAPSSEESVRLGNQVAVAHANGQSVLAAAGNNADAVGNPASEPGVFAVAAGDKTGAFCSFSNRGAGVDVVAPGCDVDLAGPDGGQLWSGYESGTSGASITASVALALLRSYRPDLSWGEAERLLTSCVRQCGGWPVLDVEAVFRAAGLGALVNAAKARVPAPGLPTAAPDPTSKLESISASFPTRMSPGRADRDSLYTPTTSTRRYPAPRLSRAVRRNGRIIVSVRNHPRGARLVVVLEVRLGEFAYRTIGRASQATSNFGIRLPRGRLPGRLRLRYQLPNHPNRTSEWVYRSLPR